ncbi:MFS transporter [Nocardia sp. NPDC049149]|uniref:MFS transporter n=1 Tax=Nocardia sp. NPDC049149 TaxID=3364315 RepID=UPI00371389AB
MLLWSGHSVSLIGSQVTVLALPLVAAITLGASAWEMGVLVACGRAPYLVLGLPAGVWIDRWPRRKVFMVCALGQAVTLAMVPLAGTADLLSLALLAVVAFVAGAFAVFADIATLSLVPMVVPRDQLTSSQGALETSQSVSQIAGPALAGWLVQVLTAPLAILADAVSFLVAAITMGRIRIQEPSAGKEPGAGMIHQIMAGAGAVFGHRVLRYVTLCTTTHILFFNAFTAVFVLYLVRDLGMSPSVVGAALSAGAVGGVIGSIAAARLSARIGMGRTMTGAIVVAGTGSALVVVARDSSVASVALVAGTQVLMWCALQIYNVLQVPVRYAVTPAAMHGRVNATVRTTVWGTAPLGALIGGLAGNLVGLPTTLIVSGVGAALAAVWLIGTRVTRIDNLDAAMEFGREFSLSPRSGVSRGSGRRPNP